MTARRSQTVKALPAFDEAFVEASDGAVLLAASITDGPGTLSFEGASAVAHTTWQDVSDFTVSLTLVVI